MSVNIGMNMEKEYRIPDTGEFTKILFLYFQFYKLSLSFLCVIKQQLKKRMIKTRNTNWKMQ